MIQFVDCGLSERKWYTLPFCTFSIVYLTVLILIAVPVFLLILFIHDPDQPMYVYQFIPSTWKDSVAILTGFALLETLQVFWKFTATIVSYIYWCAAVFQNLIWLDSLIE